MPQWERTYHEDKSDAVSAAHEAKRRCGLGRGGRVEVGADVGRRGRGAGRRRSGGKGIDEAVEEEGGPVSEPGEERHGWCWCMCISKRTSETDCNPRHRQAPRDPGIAEGRVEAVRLQRRLPW